MSKDVVFHYGALSDELAEQAKAQGCVLQNADKWQKIYDSMIMCWIADIVTDSQKTTMMRRFQKNMMKDLKVVEND